MWNEKKQLLPSFMTQEIAVNRKITRESGQVPGH